MIPYMGAQRVQVIMTDKENNKYIYELEGCQLTMDRQYSHDPFAGSGTLSVGSSRTRLTIEGYVRETTPSAPPGEPKSVKDDLLSRLQE